MRMFYAFAFGLGLVAQTSFAANFQNADLYNEDDGVIEAGLVTEADLQELSQNDTQFMSRTGEIIAGSIVGGIVGAVAADVWDDQFARGPGPGRPGPGGPGHGPGRPGPHPGPGGPRHDRWVNCFAQNARGQIFRAVGQIARNTQRRALNQCYRVSINCRPLGCR